MSDDVKIVGMLIGGALILAGILAQCVAESERSRKSDPIVETCVKHPATVSPFKSGY